MDTISFADFTRVALRVGRVIQVEDFPKARKPAYLITCDFGSDIGIQRTSAQVTDHYTKDALLDRLIIGLVNLPPKQIGPVRSAFLLTGFADSEGKIVLAVPDKDAPLGAALC